MELSARSIQSCVAVALLLAILPQTSLSQQGNTAAASGVQSAGANSGTYYIEDEILAYRSLQMNSQSIADSLQTKLSSTAGIVVVPSVSTLLPAFQLWRSNMLITRAYVNQANNILQSAYASRPGNQPIQTGPCPARQIESLSSSTSFAGYATGITQGVGVIQSILSLFTSNQSAAGFQGTVQDQALMMAVSQEIRTNNNGKNLTVLLPDVFTPWNIDLGEDNPGSKYFIGRLSQLVTGLSNLQDYYICNQLVVGAGQQLAQGEQTLDADLTKLATTKFSDSDLAAIRSDVANQESQIEILRKKIGLDITQSPVTDWKASLDNGISVLADPASTGKLKILQGILFNEAAVIGKENTVVVVATSASSKAQSVLTGISGYLSALTGGAVTLSTQAPTTTSAPAATPSTTSTAAQPNPAATTSGSGGTQTQAGSPQGGATQAAASPSSSAPPIVTILQADGLARRMQVEPDKNAAWNSSGWKVLWLKALESGSTTDMRSNIWGEKVRFAGGAVSGYALFQMDGTLVCSGNAAAYGGEIEPKNFTDAKNLKVETLILLNSDCKQRVQDPAK
jgi:hypothetical protein